MKKIYFEEHDLSWGFYMGEYRSPHVILFRGRDWDAETGSNTVLIADWNYIYSKTAVSLEIRSGRLLGKEYEYSIAVILYPHKKNPHFREQMQEVYARLHDVPAAVFTDEFWAMFDKHMQNYE